MPARKGRKAPARRAPAAGGRTPDSKRAVQDEWGLYDPHAAGFEALFARLESIENGESPQAAAPPRRAPRPLAMWVFQIDLPADPPAAVPRRGPDEFRGLVSQFSIPHAVAAVGYASGARIRRVRVRPSAPAANATDPRVVILSRKLLKAARRTPRPRAA